MAIVARRLKEKVVEVKEFNVTEEQLVKVMKRRKNWSSPGIEGIQNYSWKKFKPGQQGLCSALKRFKENYNLIPNWNHAERTVIENESVNVRERRPITCQYIL